MVSGRLHHRRRRRPRRSARRSASSRTPTTAAPRAATSSTTCAAELIKRSTASSACSRGGLKVYTTIDLGCSRLARQAIADRLPPGDPSAALVTDRSRQRLHPRDGLVGDYADSKFNLAAAGAPPAGLDVQGDRPDGRARARASTRTRRPTSRTPLQPGWMPAPRPARADRRPLLPRHDSPLERRSSPPTTPSTRSSAPTSGPRSVARRPTTWASRRTSTAIPPRRSAASRDGVSPLEMARRLRDDRRRRLAQQADRDPKVVFPDGHVDAARQAASA